MERWRDRVALVTGASVGIGAAICRDLANHGMKVIGCARNVDKIQKIAADLPKGSLLPVKYQHYQGVNMRCDLSVEEDIENLFKEIREKYGRLDICINNAGFSKYAPLLSGETEDWRAMLDVNVLALCICTREAIKLMEENNIDDGQIINISSMAGHRVPPSRFVFYSGTKFMVRAVTEGLRQELKAKNSHIRVASISPGVVKTEFMYSIYPEDRSRGDALYSSLESLLPEDISSLVISILQTHPRVNVNDILVRPVEQEF